MAASSSTTSTSTTPAAAGWRTGPASRSSASTTGGRPSTGSPRRRTTSTRSSAWLDREAAALGLDGPAYVHGDSAGGNLALVAALRHPGRFDGRGADLPVPRPDGGLRLLPDRGDGFDPREAAWYWQQYAASPADLDDPDLAPLRSDRLGTLPRTLVVTAEHDPLRDEGEELAGRLAEAGVAVTATRYLGQIHGFWRHDSGVPGGRRRCCDRSPASCG